MKSHFGFVCVLIAAVLLAGCPSEVDDKPAAEIVETKKDEKAVKAVDDGVEKKGDKAAGDKAAGDKAMTVKGWPVDLAASKLHVVGSKVTGDHTVMFQNFTGGIEVKDSDAVGISFEVQMDKFTTEMGDSGGGAKLVSHLKSPDFFDVKNHVTSTFKSTKITKGDSAAGTHSVEGDLTMRGVTKRIAFAADIKVEGKVATGKASFTINRQDFGIKYPGKKDNLIKDNVLMKLDFKFAQK
jgi:polyisoprenoid-binding protein YceI